MIFEDGRKKYIRKPYVFWIYNGIFAIAVMSLRYLNSDIHMPNVDSSFGDFIMEEAKESLIFGNRVEIKSLHDLNGFFYIGHDFFFFDKKLTGAFPKEEFFIGQPAWDYWIVFIAMVNGLKIKKIANPIAFHISHRIRWNEGLNKKLINMIISKYFDRARGLLNDKWEIDNYTRFHYLINDYPQRIVYSKKADYSILVVYNHMNADIGTSLTYKSIEAQTYGKLRIVECTKTEFDVNSAAEDLVLFVSEGSELSIDYFKTMVNYVELGDYCVCGFKLKADQYDYMREIYPVDRDSMTLDNSAVVEECVLYRMDMLAKYGGNATDLSEFKMSFINNALVYIDYEDYIMKRISRHKDKQIYIYGAGGHTKELLKKVNFSGYNICGILDGNESLDGTSLGGYEVYHASRIKELDIDYILISSISYENEIYEELKIVFDENRLIRIYFS